MATPVLIVGAGGFGRAVREALRARPGIEVLGFLDDRAGSLPSVDGLPVLGPCNDFATAAARDARLVVAIGRNADRERISQAAQAAGLGLMAVIHHQAVVADNACIGEGSIVMAGAVLGAAVQLGAGCIVNYGAVLDHDCQLEAFARVGAGGCLGGGARLGRRAVVHEGAVVRAGGQVAEDDEVPPPVSGPSLSRPT